MSFTTFDGVGTKASPELANLENKLWGAKNTRFCLVFKNTKERKKNVKEK